jgi:hypothetical protein
MIKLDIEELNRENGLFVRSCRVKINGNTLQTPVKTIGINFKNSEEFQSIKPYIDSQFSTLGEIYVKLSLSDINNLIDNDDEGKRFCSRLTDRVSQLKEVGAVPYILFSITDDSGYPYNRLLPNKALGFIFNVLWGVPGNSIISTPLLGTLNTPGQYKKLIDAFHQRQIDSIDRKNQPLMAIVPSAYNLIDPKLLEKYWGIGCRIFGYNCENRKYGAYAHTLERMHHALSNLRKQGKDKEENYIINALNSRLKIGKESTSRIHNLIGTGYGFDAYSPNHVRAFPKKDEPQKQFVFNPLDYGYVNFEKLCENSDVDTITESNTLKKIDLSEIPEMGERERKKICQQHNFEKISNEIKQYRPYIESNKLLEYLSTKNKIKPEKSEIESLHYGTYTATFDGWTNGT